MAWIAKTRFVCDRVETMLSYRLEPKAHAGRLKVGDRVFLRPTSMRELCTCFSHLCLVQVGAIVDEMDTYRV